MTRENHDSRTANVVNVESTSISVDERPLRCRSERRGARRCRGSGCEQGSEDGFGGAEQLVLDLSDTDLRENALLELSKKRELFQDLAPLLWNSFGTITALLQEIVSIYPMLSPPTLNPAQSNRVCNTLDLFQCVASHPDTRMLFLKAHIPLYLYLFLNIGSKTRPFEYLRLTSLGVIGALVKVAIFIVPKILMDDLGLDYICTTAVWFFAVGRVLSYMVPALAELPSSRLLKHIIRCYLRLADNRRACDALRSCLPDLLRDGTFSTCLREDPTTRRWLQQLLNIESCLPSSAWWRVRAHDGQLRYPANTDQLDLG